MWHQLQLCMYQIDIAVTQRAIAQQSRPAVLADDSGDRALHDVRVSPPWLLPCQLYMQALRIDACAAPRLRNGGLISISSMGQRLRQLALLGLRVVSDGNVMTTLEQLPMLQASTYL